MAGQIERPGPAHASPEGMTVGLDAKMSQNHRRLTDLGSALTSRIIYGDLSQTIRDELQHHDVLGHGNPVVVKFQLDFANLQFSIDFESFEHI